MTMNRPHRTAITPEPHARAQSGTSPSRETPADLTLPSSSGEPPPSLLQAGPRTGRKSRRWQTFVHPLQARMLSLVISYSLIIFVMLTIPVFRPLMQGLVDPAISWQKRAVVATDFLDLHDRYWPWALAAGFVLVIHCIHSMWIVNHVAGPLYRLKNVFRQIGEGNLSIRVTLRQWDYLVPEAELVNQMTAQLQARISASKQAQATLALDVDRLTQVIATGGDPTLATLAKQMEQDLADLTTSLDSFKTQKV